MPLAAKLAAVEQADEALREAEADLAAKREQFRTALAEAHEAGASFGLLGRATGRSRQRIAEIVGHENSET